MAETVADPDTFIGHDLSFHRAIVAAGGNLLLAQLSDLLHTALAAARQVHTRNVRRNKRSLPRTGTSWTRSPATMPKPRPR